MQASEVAETLEFERLWCVVVSGWRWFVDILEGRVEAMVEDARGLID